jgi:sensor c-di-GMP phosphodiesterase-like protein
LSHERVLGDETHAIVATADAAATAARDSMAAARWMEDFTAAAQQAACAADRAASRARHATAATVAAAAAAAAEVAAETAAAVQTETEVQASKVAAAAVEALQNVVVDLPEAVDPEWARRAAAAVASTVAAEVIARAQLADVAPSKVRDAVALAAEGAALAAFAAASIVEGAARSAGKVAREVANSSVEAKAASTASAKSTARVADLATRGATLLYRAPLVIELAEALKQGQLRLHYQPLYNTETGALVAVEALLRWQTPHAGCSHRQNSSVPPKAHS